MNWSGIVAEFGKRTGSRLEKSQAVFLAVITFVWAVSTAVSFFFPFFPARSRSVNAHKKPVIEFVSREPFQHFLSDRQSIDRFLSSRMTEIEYLKFADALKNVTSPVKAVIPPKGISVFRPASGEARLNMGLDVDINCATRRDLTLLSGVGPATADSIINDRLQNGPFADIEDLLRVNGIGPKTLERLSQFLTTDALDKLVLD